MEIDSNAETTIIWICGCLLRYRLLDCICSECNDFRVELMLEFHMEISDNHGCFKWFSLQWRQDWLLNHLFMRRSRKTSKLRVTGLCEANSLVTGKSPAQMADNAKTDSFDDVIMLLLLFMHGCVRHENSYSLYLVKLPEYFDIASQPNYKIEFRFKHDQWMGYHISDWIR